MVVAGRGMGATAARGVGGKVAGARAEEAEAGSLHGYRGLLCRCGGASDPTTASARNLRRVGVGVHVLNVGDVDLKAARDDAR